MNGPVRRRSVPGIILIGHGLRNCKKGQERCRVAAASLGDSVESEFRVHRTNGHFIIFEGGPDNPHVIATKLGAPAGVKWS